MKKIFYSLFTSILIISSCGKENQIVNEPDPFNQLDTITVFKGILLPQAGKITLNFENYFKTSPVVYANQNYITNANDTISFSDLSYRISNVQLYDQLKLKWVDIGTYKLNSGGDAFKYSFTINNVPAGLYNNIRFNIGVDSLRNHSGDQTGDLDPALGMYWSWTNGYIHFRIEGRLQPSLTTFSIHIGGSENVVNKSIDLTNYAVKNASNGLAIGIKFNINQFFSSPNLYYLKTDPKDIHDQFVPEIKLKLLPNMLNMVSLIDVKAN